MGLYSLFQPPSSRTTRPQDQDSGNVALSVEERLLEDLQVEVINYAPVVLEHSVSGNPRLRCQVCNKVAFESEADALKNRDYIHSKGGPRMRQYKGRYPRVYGQSKGTPCGWWHLSKGRKR